MVVKFSNTIQVFTFGCSMNIAESEMIEGMLTQSGYKVVKDSNEAEILYFNSCFVKNPTESRLISRLKEACKNFPNKKIIIGGCMPEVRSEDLKKLFPTSSLIGTSAMHKIPELIPKILQGEIVKEINLEKQPKLGYPRKRKNEFIGIVPISEGCTNQCTFCCTRLARGKINSFDSLQILKEINHLLENGCKEIWITAQDSAAYQYDSKKLPELLKEINLIDKFFFYRIGMMNPSNLMKILPNYLEMLKDDKMYKFIHLPLQSGSNEILTRMNRLYTSQDFLNILKQIRAVTRISLATDIIAGFPGETEEDYEQTLNMLMRIQPDIVNISQFGARPKTSASKMPNKIKSQDIKERSRLLTGACDDLTFLKNKTWINWEGKVLISELGKKSGVIGRNYCYKPILLNIDKKYLGKFVDVRVNKVGKGYLIGELIKC